MTFETSNRGYPVASPAESPARPRSPTSAPLTAKRLAALATDVAGPALAGLLLDHAAASATAGSAALGLAAGLVLAAIGLPGGGYSRPSLQDPPFGLLIVLWCSALALTALPGAWQAQGSVTSAAQLALLGVLGGTAVLGCRELLASLFAAAHARDWLARRTCAVVAAERRDAEGLARRLRHEPDIRSATAVARCDLGLAGCAGAADQVVVLAGGFAREDIAAIMDDLRELGLAASFVAGSAGVHGIVRPRDAYGALPVFHHRRGPLGRVERLVKRGFDVTAGGLALFILAPVLAGVGGALALQRRGPVMLRQLALDFEGRPLLLRRFHARPGGMLERSGLAELPLLLDVLGGALSLVGPRPLLPQSSAVDVRLARQAARQGLKPGLCAPEQRRATDSGRWDYAPPAGAADHTAATLAAVYVDQWSLGLDASILLGAVGRLCCDRSPG